MRLEIMGFKVISLTSDGSSPNRKVYRLMKDRADPTTPGYRCPNTFTDEDRSLYFITDVPHLLKTTLLIPQSQEVEVCIKELHIIPSHGLWETIQSSA